MTDTDRLAAALDRVSYHVVRDFAADGDEPASVFAAAILAADPTLICPDPEAHQHRERCHNYDPDSIIAHLHSVIDSQALCPDPEAHALADAVRRLMETGLYIDLRNFGFWTLELHDDNGVRSSHDGDTIEAVITAALEDKP